VTLDPLVEGGKGEGGDLGIFFQRKLKGGKKKRKIEDRLNPKSTRVEVAAPSKGKRGQFNSGGKAFTKDGGGKSFRESPKEIN